MSSANTGAATTKLPRRNAASSAVSAARLSAVSSAHNATITLVSIAVVIQGRVKEAFAGRAGGHSPRKSRSQRAMPFLPGPMPGVPIPRYLENVLRVRTGRTRIPNSSFSNSSLSPARTPRICRTSRGMVICPLLVILASFCILVIPSLL